MSGWQRSSFCSGGACLEVLVLPGGWVHVRQSTQPERIALVCSPDEWAAFLAGVKAGEFEPQRARAAEIACAVETVPDGETGAGRLNGAHGPNQAQEETDSGHVPHHDDERTA